jgi:hypothetical protein
MVREVKVARYATWSRGAFTQSALAQLSRISGVIMILYKVSTSSRRGNQITARRIP